MIFRPYSQQRQCMTYVKNHFLSLSIIQNLFYSIIIIDESSILYGTVVRSLILIYSQIPPVFFSFPGFLLYDWIQV
jgi:hypothetical protein